MRLIIIVLDGWGLRAEKKGNAVALADTPTFDKLWKECPHTRLKASGKAVGLPSGFIGNSEVGHLNIGAGRIVQQELTRINRAIETGAFFKNKVILNALKKKETVHILGLCSDGGVHSHIKHLIALLRLARKRGVKKIWLHLFLDGRDVPPKSALHYLSMLKKHLGYAKIGSVCGRYYAMDRDKRWKRTQLAYNALLGIAPRKEDIESYINDSYAKGVTDEFIKPVVIGSFDGIKDGDNVFFFNIRSDRARQLSWAIVKKRFGFFPRKKIAVRFSCMCEYDPKLGVPIAFPPQRIVNSFGEVLSKSRLKQLRIAETEKYAHVTFFFNGGREKPFRHEKRILIQSPKVATYDLKPEMSAPTVTKRLLHVMDSADVVILNFANPDMVGHTGNIRAAISAVECVDGCLGKVIERVEELNAIALITADHGNCEEMVGRFKTSHTLNDVPFIVFNKHVKLRKRGILADIAPTALELLGIKKPKEMTGKSLIQA